MKKLLLVLGCSILFFASCTHAGNLQTTTNGQQEAVSQNQAGDNSLTAAKNRVGLKLEYGKAPLIIDKFLPWGMKREILTREYALKHYAKEETKIIPRVVVVHWTAGPTWQSAYQWFYKADRGDGTVNVSSQFLVDRDGSIYRLMPENKLARHIIGYNWCAIGIENVGGVENKEDLTPAQLKADTELIRYLQSKYPTIKFVWGHYQQNAARASGLYLENVPGYQSVKSDPGPKFMRSLRLNLETSGLIFYPE